MLLVIFFTASGGRMVFSNGSTELNVGFMIGVSAMLTELFFVLMVMFFTIGQSSGEKGYETAPADKAYAVFSLLNMIIYFVWTVILTVHRNTIINGASQGQQNYTYDDGETYNPALNGGHDGFQGDQEEL